jgi:glycosyltransferase involved in cell wall biosynthesis
LFLLYKWKNPDIQYDFFRSKTYRLLTGLKVYLYSFLYNAADVDLFLTYSAYIKNKRREIWMLSDWSLEQFIQNQLKRPPYEKEMNYIQHELSCLRKADKIISLFPLSASFLSNRLHRTVDYMGSNVVNNYYNDTVSEKLIVQKRGKKSILFIGRSAYIDGAKVLLKAFKLLKAKDFPIELHFIGIEEKHLGIKGESDVFCYGYLRKENIMQCQKYYQLMCNATVFVNPCQEWGGYSSMIEAMYFYTPVVVAPYNEFVNEFGKNIGFGLYTTDDAIQLASNIRTIVFSHKEDYEMMAKNAHEAVKNYTWENYVDKLLKH